jgi:formyl-CoA transferase
VQTSLLQSQLFMLDFQGARYLMRGELPGQAGNNHPTGSPTGVFPTRDGHVNLAPTPPMWRRFCEAIGRNELVEHPDYATNKLRVKNRPALHSVIEAITREHTSEALVEKMNQAGIPCGPINNVSQAFADPQVRHLGIAQSVHSEKLGDITLLGQPFTLSRTPSSLAVGAPEYGEHTDEVLREAGFSDGEIARFRAAKAI